MYINIKLILFAGECLAIEVPYCVFVKTASDLGLKTARTEKDNKNSLLGHVFHAETSSDQHGVPATDERI